MPVALTQDQENTIEMQRQITLAAEQAREPMESKRIKADLIRTAQAVAIENHRTATNNAPITADDLVAFATQLEAFIST